MKRMLFLSTIILVLSQIWAPYTPAIALGFDLSKNSKSYSHKTNNQTLLGIDVCSPKTLENQNINITLKQGTSTSKTVVLTNNGNTDFVMTASLSKGSKWVSLTPTSITVKPNKKATFTLKISAFTDMSPGKYTETAIFFNGISKSSYVVNLTVLENTSIPRPDFTLACQETLMLPFETGSYNYATIQIKNIGNCDISPVATIVSDPVGFVKLYPDTAFSVGKILKGSSTAANILLLVKNAFEEQIATVTFTFTHGNIKRTCNIKLIRSGDSNYTFSGQQLIKMDFVGKTKNIAYTITNSGSNKANFKVNLYIGTAKCLSVSPVTPNKNLTVEPGKTMTVSVTFKLSCVLQYSQISGYLLCTRTDNVTGEQASKILDFVLVK